MYFGTSDAILAVVALLPAVALGIYVFKKDRHEKEPFWLLALLFVSGVIIAWPVVEVETFLDNTIFGIFSSFGISSEGSTVYVSDAMYYLYHLCDNIIGIALVEEGFKWLMLFLITRKSKHFNSLFDGVIYAVFVSLGFAALENVLYVFSYGLETGLLRAVTAVPGHVFDAVIMGYCYSFYHIYEKAQTYEKQFVDLGVITSNQQVMSRYKKIYLAASIIAPVFIHGMYDFMLSVDSVFWSLFFYIFLAGLYIYSFRTVRKFSKQDNDDQIFALSVLITHHPRIKDFLLKMQNSAENQNTVNV